MSPSDPLLQQILRRLILRSFSTLRRRQIRICWGAEDELLYCATEDGQYTIAVNNVLQGAGRRVLEGGIAHELCHIEADLQLGSYQRQLAWERYARSRWARMREERVAEQRVIELGYGTHLLELIRFTRRLGYSFEREHGLSYVEVLRAEALRMPIQRRKGVIARFCGLPRHISCMEKTSWEKDVPV